MMCQLLQHFFSILGFKRDQRDNSTCSLGKEESSMCVNPRLKEPIFVTQLPQIFKMNHRMMLDANLVIAESFL